RALLLVSIAILPLLPPTLYLTLFPYTTLFRSGELLGDRILVEPRLGNVEVEPPLGVADRAAGHRERRLGRRRRGAARLRHSRGGDRKSTRLNSSHLVISYAVFCLKKKNPTYT